MQDVPMWIAISAQIATVIAAIAAAATAWWARDAALASKATARDAGEALALAIRPDLSGEPLWEGAKRGPSTWTFGFSNVSPFDAVDVEIEVHHAGGVARAQFPRVSGVDLLTREHLPQQDAIVVVEDMVRDGGALSLEGSVVIRYSDSRRLARWEVVRVTKGPHYDQVTTVRGPVRIDDR